MVYRESRRHSKRTELAGQDRNTNHGAVLQDAPEISADVIASYRAADYRAGTVGDAFTLRVNQYSEPLARLFTVSGHQCAVFITACNPFGRLQSHEVNLAACALLHQRLWQLVNRKDHIIEGVGCDPAGLWPAEKSFLALGLGLEASRNLGREFCQNAVVWMDEDAIPKLVLLRQA
ncbi:MAG: DUF3293 domain-containing protein [Nitrosospira sp.]|nr:DUF3293 domain-containing protein [Nitrosospira sp.]